MDTKQNIKQLKLTLAVSSYPVLESVNYFRDYNNYVENNLKESISKVRKPSDEKDYKGKTELLTIDVIEKLAKAKMYGEFGNMMRFSLFIALYAFVEKVVTNSCIIEGREEKYKTYKNNNNNTQSKSMINIAKEFLISEGYTKIDNVPGWDYIDNMREIRNQFVHGGGTTTESINNMVSKYDFEIEDNQIILGEKFTVNFLGIVESFSLEFAEIVYPDESKINSMMQKILNHSN